MSLTVRPREPIGAEILDERRFRSHFIFLDSELLRNDFLDPLVHRRRFASFVCHNVSLLLLRLIRANEIAAAQDCA